MNNNQSTKSNFGATGWYYVIFTAILFYFNTVVTTDGLNVTVAAFEELRGWDQASLLNYATIGGYVAIAAAPFLATFMSKVGTRLTMTSTLLVSGAALIWWGLASSPAQYLLACAIYCACSNAFSHLASSNLANTWFPKKKGLFLGWSTMGLQISTVLGVAMLSVMLTLGVSGAYIVLAVIHFALALLAFFTIKDSPEQAGKYPDNTPMTDEEMQQYIAKKKEFVSSLTLKDILTNKNVWLIGISFGILYMASIGLLSQWVPRLMTKGYEQDTAIMMLSVAAAIGIFGSYAWGWLDMKIGPKKASVGIMLNYVIALVLTVLPFSTVTLYISMILIGLGIGGVANLVGSLVGTIFGPHEFPRVFGIVNTIEGIVRVTAYSVLAFGLTYLGGYTGAYMIFLGLCIIGTIMMVFVKE